jgi:hypothetical protein
MAKQLKNGKVIGKDLPAIAGTNDRRKSVWDYSTQLPFEEGLLDAVR